MVRLLLDKGANANAPTKYKTPLMHAAEKGHAAVVKLLLAKGANVNALTDEGTALMLAAAGGRADVVKLLVAAGAQVNAKDRLERTALLVSAMSTVPKVNPQRGSPPARPSSEVMQLLLAGGADANAKERWGKTALMLANSADKVRLLVAHGVDVNAKDQEGQMALMEAADRGDAEIVEALLAGGADVNARGAKGATALILAFRAERPGPQDKVKSSAEVVQLLLNRNADTNVQNKDGETALMRAVKLVDVEAVKLLLARGADVGAVDALGNTAMVFAYIDGNTEIEKLLESSAPARQTPETVNAFLRAAVAKKDADRVNELLAHGADPNFVFPIDYSHMDIKDNVLVMAARAGHAGIVQMLLEKGADVNARGLVYGSESGIKFGTALEAAEFSRQSEVVALLKKAAANK
jgi:ankyrin repeat protein